MMTTASIFMAYTQVDYTGNHGDVDHKDLAEIKSLFFREFSPAEFSNVRRHEAALVYPRIKLVGVAFPLYVIFYFAVSPSRL